MLRYFINEAGRHGILVLLSCHRLHRSYSTRENNVHAEWPGDWDGLWFDHEYPASRVASLSRLRLSRADAAASSIR